MAFEFKLPDIGEGLTEGEVVKWLVSEGDVVEEDQPMVEVMTDKATVEITAPVAGTIASLKAGEGDVVPVGNVLVVIDDGGSGGAAAEAAPAEEAPDKAAPAAQEPTPEAPPAPAAASAPQSSPPPASTPAPAASGPLRERTLAAPATRKKARELGIDLNSVPASGPNGRVTRQDLESFAASGGAAAQPAAASAAPGAGTSAAPLAPQPLAPTSPSVGEADERIPLRGLRGKIAEQMVRSKQFSPHFTFAEEVDMTALVELRRRVKESAAEQGAKLTFLPFIMKALTACFRKFPSLNALVDDARNEYVIRKEYNIGLATDTDDGLTVPVIKNVERRSIVDIAKEISRVTEAARDKKISVDDLKGGTFTITSAGSIGGILATPILNYPEVGILGIYKIHEKPVVRDGEIVIRRMCNMTITLDHRIVDGATAARFMNELIRLLQNPELLLIEGV